jgi:hypothetical protein
MSGWRQNWSVWFRSVLPCPTTRMTLTWRWGNGSTIIGVIAIPVPVHCTPYLVFHSVSCTLRLVLHSGHCTPYLVFHFVHCVPDLMFHYVHYTRVSVAIWMYTRLGVKLLFGVALCAIYTILCVTLCVHNRLCCNLQCTIVCVAICNIQFAWWHTLQYTPDLVYTYLHYTRIGVKTIYISTSYLVLHFVHWRLDLVLHSVQYIPYLVLHYVLYLCLVLHSAIYTIFFVSQ